jgi:hypothetical protein
MLDIAAPANKTSWVVAEMNRKVKPRAVCRRRAQLIRMMAYSQEPKQDLPKATHHMMPMSWAGVDRKKP